MVKNFFRHLSILLLLMVISLGIAPSASAFCGFFVSKADAKLYNSSSRVVIARNGNHSLFMMANNFQGNVKDFVRIVPIPVVPKREQVRIGNNEFIEKLDAFTAPRLVQYFDNVESLWQREYQGYLFAVLLIVIPLLIVGLIIWDLRTGRIKLAQVLTATVLIIILGAISLPSFLNQANKGKSSSFLSTNALNIKVEDQFTVGEYDIAILSAEQSNGLTTWLTQNGYKVSENAQAMLQDYIKQGMKFFVIKINLSAFNKQGYGFLRPIAIEYDSPKFMLPIRLGTLNATSDQDLIIHILSPNYFAEVANYRTVFIPTDNKSGREPSGTELPSFIAEDFGDFYQTVFQREYERYGKSVAFLEYAGPIGLINSNGGKCDPCTVSPADLLKIQKLLAAEGLSNFSNITRLHVRYNQDKFPQDLIFKEVSNDDLIREVDNAGKYLPNSTRVVFQGRYVIRRQQGEASALAKWRYSRWQNHWAENLASLTGWDLQEINQKTILQGKAIELADNFNQQGGKLANSGQFQAALYYYKKAINIDAGNATAWLNQGLALYELKRLPEALKSMNQAVALDANNPYARRFQEQIKSELNI